MLIETDRIISITTLQKELTQTVRELSETGEAVYVLKNNKMEAVIVPFEEYRHLMDLEEMYEYFEIEGMINKRLTNYDAKKSVKWSDIKV